MGWTSFVRQEMGLGQNDPVRIQKYKKRKKYRRCRGSNPGHPRDRREYLPLYYNDRVGGYNATKIIQIKVKVWRPTLGKRTRESVIYIPFGT